MGQSCLTCGGLIAEPGMSYGYAGKFCHCYVPVQIQRTSFGGGHISVDFAQYENLKEENAALKQALVKAKEALESVHIDDCGWDLDTLDIDTAREWHKSNNVKVESALTDIEKLTGEGKSNG